MKKLNYLAVALACLLSVPAQAQKTPEKTVNACIVELTDLTINLKLVSGIAFVKDRALIPEQIDVYTAKSTFTIRGGRDYYKVLVERMKLCHSN